MERTKWTDDLLDERFGTMDEKSDLLFSESRAIRDEVAGLRTEMHAGFASLRTELSTQLLADRENVAALHRQVLALHGGALVAVIGLLGVLVAQA
jgi:hypothetical protein